MSRRSRVGAFVCWTALSASLVLTSCSRINGDRPMPTGVPSINEPSKATSAYSNAWTMLWASLPETQAAYDEKLEQFGFSGAGELRRVSDAWGETTVNAVMGFDGGLRMITIGYAPKAPRAIPGPVLEALAKHFTPSLSTEPDVIEFSNGVMPGPSDIPGRAKMGETVRVRISDGAWIATERTITWTPIRSH